MVASVHGGEYRIRSWRVVYYRDAGHVGNIGSIDRDQGLWSVPGLPLGALCALAPPLALSVL